MNDGPQILYAEYLSNGETALLVLLGDRVLGGIAVLTNCEISTERDIGPYASPYAVHFNDVVKAKFGYQFIKHEIVRGPNMWRHNRGWEKLREPVKMLPAD